MILTLYFMQSTLIFLSRLCLDDILKKPGVSRRF